MYAVLFLSLVVVFASVFFCSLRLFGVVAGTRVKSAPSVGLHEKQRELVFCLQLVGMGL